MPNPRKEIKGRKKAPKSRTPREWKSKANGGRFSAGKTHYFMALFVLDSHNKSFAPIKGTRRAGTTAGGKKGEERPS